MDATADRLLQFDEYEVDTLRRELRRDGIALPLTSKAFDVLSALIESRHEVVSKDALIAAVWPRRVVEENNLTQAIAALRRAFGVDAHDHRYILTVPGRGYRFVGELRTQAGANEVPAGLADPAAADRALVRAQFRLHQRDLSAPRAFLEAIRLDPANARAYAGLVNAYLFLAHRDVAPAEVFPLARAASLQALRIDPELAEVRMARGRVLQLVDWDWAGAEAELRHAIAIDPNRSESHSSLAHVLVTTGRFEEGLSAVRRARELDPLSPMSNALEGGFFSAMNRPEAARACLDRALALEPDFWIALLVRAGLALDAGDAAGAVADLKRAASAQAGRVSLLLATLAQACVANGQTAEALGLLRELQARQAEGYVPSVNIAAIHLALGDHEAALDQLERAREARDIRMVFLGIDARWNPLRESPRFRALLRALHLPDCVGYSRL